MSNHPTQDVVAAEPAGDAADEIQADPRCHCGYPLRELDNPAGRCPECGREVQIVLGDLEQASLDGRARRRLGASLLIANHLVWLCMMTSWYVGIRTDLRGLLSLLAAAGPRSVTSIEVFKPGTVREFATSVCMLGLLQLTGVWMLTTFREGEDLEPQRRAGLVLRYAYLTGLAAVAGLFLLIDSTDRRMLICLNLFELPVGFLLGAYITQLGLAERSRLLVVGGRVLSVLLAVGSFAIAFSVFSGWSASMRPRPSFYVGLAASAAGGLLLLALLVRLRMLLARDLATASDDA